MPGPPSPGGIYPNLSLLEDEGLITMSVEDGRKMATLTADGRGRVEANVGRHPTPTGSVPTRIPGAVTGGLPGAEGGGAWGGRR